VACPRHAFSQGWIAGAGLDDTEEEPAEVIGWQQDSPLFSLDTIVITPHPAYYSEEAIGTVRRFAAAEVARVRARQPPLSPVNADELVDARRSPSLLVAGA
jgi:D-3-phosphoglycerate dehydrogenase